MAIRFFDMFAGIGGFRSRLEAVGGFECIGHCEIDKYANQAYNAIYDVKGELYFEDARTINPNDLSEIDLICAGFPCQSFSVAGKRLGFADDTRGTLFFEVARIAEAKRPAYIVVLSCADSVTEKKAVDFLKGNVQKCVVKSKTATKGLIELNLEIRMENDNTDFINALSTMSGVNSAVLVSYNGEYMG